jgi:ferritin-like metal-binding protein YciE
MSELRNRMIGDMQLTGLRAARHLHVSRPRRWVFPFESEMGKPGRPFKMRHSMGLFSLPTFDSLDALLLLEVERLYDAEQRLTKALPRMAEAASCKHLVSAFNHHLRETERHVARLEIIFHMQGMTPQTATSEAMKGLIADAFEVIDAEGEPEIKDAALIAAAQRVEHFEIAAYGSAHTFARQLGYDEVARILHEILDEEVAADRKLTEIAIQTPSMRPVESPRRGTLSIPNRSSMLR